MGGTGRIYEGWPRALAVCLLALGLLIAPAASSRAAMYWGATISGETYGQTGNAPSNQSAWDLFERHAGKKIATLNTGQGWTQFDSAEMDATQARGAIPVVTMGLGEGVTLAEIVAGQEDTAIRNWARAAKAWGHPFFFAPWWEMNGAWYSWGRDPSFIAAWRHFHDLVVAEGATNVTWTWVVNSIWYDPASDPTPYYPGDAYVDWTGLDTYNWGRNPAQPDRWINPDQTITPTLDLIKGAAPSKPIMILENASSEYGGNKTDWIREMLTTYLPHHPEINAYLWFNWNFPKGPARADWQIESSAPAQQVFRKGIQSSIYRSIAPALPSLTKVPVPATPPEDEPGALDLAPAGAMVTGPRPAVAPDGTATVVWSARQGQTFTVYERRIGPDGVPEPGVTALSTPGEDALDPEVALAPDGTATVTWIRCDGSNFVVQVRRIAADGTPGAETLNFSGAGQDAATPRVAVAPDGTATVVWKRFNGSSYVVQERRLSAAGVREASGHPLSAPGGDAVEPQVAVAGDGTATVVWSRFDGANTIVQARRVAPDGTPAASTTNLSAAGENAVEPEVGLDGDGVATVAWARFDGTATIIQARRVSAAGLPDPDVESLSAAGRSAAEPQLAVNPAGLAIVVWDRFDGANFIVQGRRVGASGAPSASILNLSAAGRDAAEPAVAIAADGAATVVWDRFDGANFIVQRRGVDATGAPAASVVGLSAAGRGATTPAVALSPDGLPIAIWKRFNGGAEVVQASSVVKPPAPDPSSPDPPPATAPPAPSPGAGSRPAATSKGSAPVADPVAIDNSFLIGRPRLDRGKGIARLPVTVPRGGKLSLFGARSQDRAVAAAGTVVLLVRPQGAAARKLEKNGSVRLKLTVTFVPSGGTASSEELRLKLRKDQG